MIINRTVPLSGNEALGSGVACLLHNCFSGNFLGTICVGLAVIVPTVAAKLWIQVRFAVIPLFSPNLLKHMLISAALFK